VKDETMTTITIERINAALSALKPEVKKPWVTLDHLPYIHATDDTNAKPYSAPVVGRFDYMESADYIMACNPAAMAEVLAHIDAQAAEIARIRAAPATAPDDRHAQELLAQEITLQNMRERHAQELCAYELTGQNLRDQIASAPAWHDAPTAPGDWVIVGDGFKSELQANITQQEIDRVSSWPGRWFGPIPEDKTE
jgi:hypothetical protein